MTKKIRVACVFALVASAGFFLTRTLTIKSQQSGFTPFTATMESRSYNPDGTLSSSHQRLYAVRSNGTKIEILKIPTPDGRLTDGKSVTDLDAGLMVSAVEATESLITHPLRAETVAKYRRAPTACTSDPTAEHSKILGYDVVRVKREWHVAGRFTLVDKWVAPALNCFALKSTSTGGAEGEPASYPYVQEVLFVLPGEPSPSLFEIPVGYVERSPSEMNAEFERRFPGHSIFPPTTAEHLDGIYQKNQQNR